MALTKVSGDFIQDGSITQSHLHASHGITTSDIGEGSNLYFTTARVDSRIGDLSTSDLSEGTNLYYTDARVGSYLTTNNYLTASSTHTLTNKSGNISQWTNDSGYITDGNTNWDNSYGFITASSTETLTNKSGNISMFTNDSGYITDGNTNWDNSYGFITASSTDTLTNKSGNISMFTNDSGYITSFDITTQTDPKYLRSNAADTLSAAITLDNNGYFVGSPGYGFRFNNSGDTINALIVDNSGNSIAYASHRAPIFYDSDNTNRYINPTGTSVLYKIQTTQAQASPGWDTAFYVLQAQHWYGDTSSQTMYLGQSSNTIQVPGSGGIRPTIVYDYDNTGFYLNPNGTSNLSTLSTDTNEGIFNNQRRNHSTAVNFNDTSLRAGINYLQQGTNGPTGTASHQWYGWRLGLGGDYGTQTGSSGHYAQEWYIARKGQGGNNTGGNFLWTRDMEGGSWGSWQKIDTDRLQLASGYSVVMGSWGLRNVTPNGYIEMGPANTSHAHIYTDRSNFYFNREIYIDGGSLLRQNDIRAQEFYDLNDTGYYLNPNSTSNVNAMVAYQYQGNGNVGGTGSASWHPSGIYSAGYNWLYGGINAGGNSVTNMSDARANIFYDYNDTGYYLNPASDSRINNINVDGAGAYPLQTSSSQRYMVQVRHTGNSTNANYGWWWFTDPNFNMGFHADGAADRLTLTRDGDLIIGQTSISYTSNDNTPVVGSNTTNRLHVNGSIQLTNNNDALVIGRGTASFFKDEEIGFGWGGGWYMIDGTYLRVRNNVAVYSTGYMYAGLYYDSDNTSFYVNPSGTSQISQMAIGTTSWDTTNLTLDVAGNASFRNGFYMGISTNNYGSWSGRIYVSGSSQYWNGQAWSFNGDGWGGGNYWTLDNSGNSIAYGSHRAPIFYDSNNTGYYTNPDGTSNIYGLTVNQQISGSISGSSNSVAITGYGNGNFTFHQTSGSFDAFSGWHNYFIGNHGSGSSYYHTMIAFPFWGSPRYSRREGGTLRGPFDFLTNERDHTTGYILQSNASLRAPIFYDSNNTGYYTNPDSISNLYQISLYNISTISRLQSGGNLNGSNNFAFGNTATLGSSTSNSSNNAAIGHSSQASNSSGDSNFSFGYASLYSLSSGSDNIAIGDACGYNVTSGSNNLLFGKNAGRTGYQTPQSIAGITTGSNQIHMGNESHTNAYIQISWTVNSDARDKTDITPIDIGLDFVNQLNPVTFRWDKRSDYEDRTPTGENKLEELTLGFLAQEVEEVEKSYGYDVATKTNLVVDRNVEQDHFGITYEKMIPILTKAIQEQQTIIDDLKSRIETLENQ